MYCVAFPEPVFHPTKTKDILVVPMRKMYHKENLWRRLRDIDGWEYWRMDGAQWLKILLMNKNLVGSSWDGEHLKKTLICGVVTHYQLGQTGFCPWNVQYLFCFIIINVYSSYLTSVLSSWFKFGSTSSHHISLPIWDQNLQQKWFFGRPGTMDPWKGMEVN